jgi:integrase
MLGLGPLHIIGLEEARDKAHEARRALLNGIDPIAQKESERAARLKSITVEAAAREFFQTHKAKYRNPKGARQFLASIETYVLPILGPLPVADIDVTLVLKVLEQPHEDGQTLWHAIPKTASHIRGRVEAILAWATTRGYRSGDNPARWTGHLKNVLPSWRSIRRVEHHPALPYVEIPEFIAALQKRPGVSAAALEFTVLTCVRTSETIGAVWSEIDFENATWNIPAWRMKAARDHRVPLVARTAESFGRQSGCLRSVTNRLLSLYLQSSQPIACAVADFFGCS